MSSIQNTYFVSYAEPDIFYTIYYLIFTALCNVRQHDDDDDDDDDDDFTNCKLMLKKAE